MAIKKRRVEEEDEDKKVKKGKKKSKEKNRNEDDDDDDVEDEDNEDEEEEDEPKRKSSKKKSSKKKSDDDDEEDEESDDDDDDRFTGKDLERFSKDPNKLPEEGDYVFKVAGHKFFPPEKGKRGGYSLMLTISEGPEEVDKPEDGWPKPNILILPKYKNPTDGQKENMRIAKRDFSAVVLACLGEVDGDEEYSVKELLKECKGQKFVASVTFDKGSDGREYQRIGNFRPYEN